MTPTTSAKTSTSKWRRSQAGGLSIGATLISCLAYWILQVWPLTTSTGFSWANFRQYFPYDQYSYLAIAVNVRNGNLAAVEPFTETGTNHYPRLYYVFLGLLARLFNADIIATWQITGLAFQFLMVVAISWLLIHLTGIPVLGVFGFLPSIIGTFAVLTAGNWHHTLDNHAVLWGAFGVLFTLNGESAAISIAVTALCLLVGVTFPAGRGRRPTAPTLRATAIVAAGAAVGLLANVQTYSFLTTVYLLLYAAGAYGLLSYGRRIHIVASLILLVAVLLGGTAIASAAGPLVTLMAGVLAAVPGFLLLMLRFKAIVISACLALGLAASPTVIGTMLGLANKDEFLTYRELSSTGLGVPLSTGLLAAIVPLLLLATIFWAGIQQQNRAWLAFSIGPVIAWPLAASNDLWGANQEPYRFWIDSFTLVTAVAVPVVLQVVVVSWRMWRGNLPSQTTDRKETAEVNGGALQPPTAISGPGIMPSASAAVAVTVVALVTVGALGFSFVDHWHFSRYVRTEGTAGFADPQARALSQASSRLIDNDSELRIRIGEDGTAPELVMYDPCINPLRLKVLTGLPVAFYNAGLAWPKEERKMREVLAKRDQNIFDQTTAEAMGAKYVLTDSGCPTGWQNAVDGIKISEVPYSSGMATAVVTLWRIK